MILDVGSTDFLVKVNDERVAHGWTKDGSVVWRSEGAGLLDEEIEKVKAWVMEHNVDGHWQWCPCEPVQA